VRIGPAEGLDPGEVPLLPTMCTVTNATPPIDPARFSRNFNQIMRDSQAAKTRLVVETAQQVWGAS
jgi:hypothetical protein